LKCSLVVVYLSVVQCTVEMITEEIFNTYGSLLGYSEYTRDFVVAAGSPHTTPYLP
jgi:hypothetical protein